MRVYGTSPLYNYVELVFRSKRLFIVSLIVATMATALVASFRSSSYNAKAIILLAASSPSTAGMAGNEDPNRGTIQFKLNVLNLCLKDPEFIKRTFKDAGFDKGLTDVQFEKFCKDATAAITPASGQNLLEISCRWKDPQCADIIEAFYGAFATRVIDEETVATSGQTKVIKSMLADYTKKQQEQEQIVIKYAREGLKGTFNGDMASMVQRRNEAEARVKMVQNGINTLQRIKTLGTTQLAKTPETIDEATTVSGLDENPQYRMLQAALTQGNLDLNKILERRTENHPEVKQKRAEIEGIKKEIQIMTLAFPKKRQNGTSSKRIGKNPIWLALQSRLTQLQFEIETANGQLIDAQREAQAANAAAIMSPVDQFNFKWATINKELYTQMRGALAGQMEQAIMAEQRDKVLKAADMDMKVHPFAEPELAGGAKGMAFLAAGPIIGLIVAFAFSLLAETLDHSLRTPMEIEKFLGKPVLAVLPRIDGPKEAQTRRLEASSGGGSGGYLPS